MSLEGLSHALSGIGKFIEKNPEAASHLLGTFGQAISPEGSWQQNLGGAMAGLSSEELQRKWLEGLFGGKKPEEELQTSLDMPFGPNVSPRAILGR